jgi:hypothetical protein
LYKMLDHGEPIKTKEICERFKISERGKLPRFSDNLKLLNLNCFTYEKVKIYRSPDCENS